MYFFYSFGIGSDPDARFLILDSVVEIMTISGDPYHPSRQKRKYGKITSENFLKPAITVDDGAEIETGGQASYERRRAEGRNVKI